MFEEMFNIARNKLENINEVVEGLPAPQVTVLLSDNNTIYVAVNDGDGTICKKLKNADDTKIIRMLTMWKDGGIDLSSINFRKALIKMDEENNNTDIILQGKGSYLIKKLAVTIP